MSDDDILKLPKKGLYGLTKAAIGILCMCALLFLCGLIGFAWDSSKASWPTISGHVMDAHLIQQRKMADQAEVSYSYTVDGKVYSGSTYFPAGADLPDVNNMKAGTPVSVYFNRIFPGMSTISPQSGNKFNMALMTFALFGAVGCWYARSSIGPKSTLRDELPLFLEYLAPLVEKGLSVPAAIEEAGRLCGGTTPVLGAWIEKSVINFKAKNIPLYQSFREIGEAFEVDELISLSSTLATADRNGGDVAFQLRRQCDSLSYKIKSEREASRRLANNFGGNRRRY